MLTLPALESEDINEPLPGKVLCTEDIPDRDQRVVFEDPNFNDWINSLGCIICGEGDNDEQLLLCDGCDRACHTYCAGLQGIPEGDWFCFDCTRARERAERQRQQPANRSRAARRGGAPRQQQVSTTAAARRRRGSPIEPEIVLIDSEDDLEDLIEDSGQPRDRRVRRRGNATTNNGGRQAMRNFIVSDDSESDPNDEYAPSNRRRRTAAQVISSDDEEEEQDEEEGEWESADDEEEEWNQGDDLPSTGPQQRTRRAGSTRQTRAASRGRRTTNSRRQRGGNDDVDEEDIPLANRLQARQRNTRLGGLSQPLIPRRHTRPTGNPPLNADQRRVASLAEHWEALRAGRANFDEFVTGNSGGGGATMRPRRLVRAGDIEAGNTTTATTSNGNLASRLQPRTDIVDLTSPPGQGGRNGVGGPSRPPGSGFKRPSGRRPWQTLASDEEDDDEVVYRSDSAAARAMIAEARYKGSKLISNKTPKTFTLPRRRASNDDRITPLQQFRFQQQQQQRTGPGSGNGGNLLLPPTSDQPGRHSRLRTVRDFHVGADLVRNTPGSGSANPNSSSPGGWRNVVRVPELQQQRQQPKPSSADKKNANNDQRNADGFDRFAFSPYKPSPPVQQQQQQQRQQPQMRQSSGQKVDSGGEWRQAHRPQRVSIPIHATAAAPSEDPSTSEPRPPLSQGRSQGNEGVDTEDSPMLPLRQRLQQQLATKSNFNLPNNNSTKTPTAAAAGVANTTTGNNAVTDLAARDFIEETPNSVASAGQLTNEKTIVNERVRKHLYPAYERNEITKEQFKLISKRVVSALWRRHEDVDDLLVQSEIKIAMEEICVRGDNL